MPFPATNDEGDEGLRSAQFVAWLERMAGEKILGGHSTSAFALQIENAQRFFTARHHDACFIGVQDFAGLAGLIRDFGLPDFEEMRTWFAGQMGESARPGRESANSVPKCVRGFRPIQATVFLGDLARMGGAFGGLWPGSDFARNVITNCLDQQRGPDLRQPVVQDL